MKNHLALLNKEQKTQTAAERLADALKEVVGVNLPSKLNNATIEYLEEKVDDIYSHVS
jgi:hypothetical protein